MTMPSLIYFGPYHSCKINIISLVTCAAKSTVKFFTYTKSLHSCVATYVFYGLLPYSWNIVRAEIFKD